MNKKKKTYTTTICFKSTPQLKELFYKAQEQNKEEFIQFLTETCNKFITTTKSENTFKYYYIYIIKFLNFYYIGQHKTNDLNDDYLCSSKILNKIKQILPKTVFSKKIIEFTTHVDINQKELYYINLFRQKFGEYCLNLTNNKKRTNNIKNKLVNDIIEFNNNSNINSNLSIEEIEELIKEC